MFQRLLICTDFTDGLQRLATFVPQLALTGAQQITFFHSEPLKQERNVPKADTQKVAEARDRLETLLKQHQSAGVKTQVKVESGQPIDLILSTAQAQHCDLIILGTTTRNALSEKLTGSTLAEVAKRSPIPLMILRPQIMMALTAEELALRCQHLFRNLLIPYDGSHAAKYAVEQIKQMTQTSSSRSVETIHLCWIVEDIRRREVPVEAQIASATLTLDAAKAELGAANLPLSAITAEVRQGEPLLELFLASQAVDVSAIAFSSDTLGKLSEFSVSSFARELMRRSWYPLIYFPCRH